jgi:DUF1707 SHOCT-like domain
MDPRLNPDLRASDEDRRLVVAALERHTTAGRLSIDEFSERVGRAFAAVTHGDLALLTHDLPRDPAVAGVSRQLLVSFLLSLGALALLFVIMVVFV